jgi:hypothetical protein
LPWKLVVISRALSAPAHTPSVHLRSPLEVSLHGNRADGHEPYVTRPSRILGGQRVDVASLCREQPLSGAVSVAIARPIEERIVHIALSL